MGLFFRQAEFQAFVVADGQEATGKANAGVRGVRREDGIYCQNGGFFDVRHAVRAEVVMDDGFAQSLTFL